MGTVLPNSLRLGATDCGLRITVGTDMGKLAVTIVDKDNKNDLNSKVCVYPTSAVTEQEIAAKGTCSSIDPGSTSTSVSIPLRPDRYLAVAMPTESAWVEYIRTNRSQGSVIEVKPHSTLQLTLMSSSGR